jgi:hypothetical protein
MIGGNPEQTRVAAQDLSVLPASLFGNDAGAFRLRHGNELRKDQIDGPWPPALQLPQR